MVEGKKTVILLRAMGKIADETITTVCSERVTCTNLENEREVNNHQVSRKNGIDPVIQAPVLRLN